MGGERELEREFADYICRGVREGFRICFDRRCKRVTAVGNMKSVEEHKGIVEEYVQKEGSLREAGHAMGAAEPLWSDPQE